MSALSEFHEAARGRLAYLADLLPPAYKLTLVARHTEKADADIMVTADDPDAIIAAVERLKSRPAVK